ncbi:hypothetical protein VNO77_03543 [Canavalia gladiata]|uniref:Uncharacterized protein n=1 Tax=Canavalia gladiata TaxID=3824 RepID=A0AAN9R6Y2_CANGL
MLGILWILRGHRGKASAWLAVFKLNQQKLGVGVRTRGLEDRGRYAQPYGLSSFAEWVSNELSPNPFRMPQDLMEHMIFEKLSGSGTQEILSLILGWAFRLRAESKGKSSLLQRKSEPPPKIFSSFRFFFFSPKPTSSPSSN